jgi:hypothetical protein
MSDGLPLAVEELSDRLVLLRRAVRAADWDAVLDASLAAIGSGHAQSLRIAALDSETAATLAYYAERAGAFTAAFQALSRREDRAQIVAGARTQLTAADPALAQRLEDVLSRIEAGATDFPSVSLAEIETLEPAPTRLPTDLAIAALSRGHRGLAYRAYNTVTSAAPDPGTAETVLDAFSAVVASRRSLLRGAQTRLFEAIKAARPADVIAVEAHALAATVELFITSFVAEQARVAPLAVALLDVGRGSDAERVGSRLAEAGLLTREAFVSHAAALALGFEMRRFRPSRLAEQVLAPEPGVEFERPLPSAPRTELSALPGTADGMMVQIRGFATAFEQRRSADGKLLSAVTLVDPSSGASAEAVAVFVHLPHAGVTEGAYLQLHGAVRASSPLLEGRPGVEIDVLALAELAERSWLVRLLRLGEPWAEVWRNGAHVQWSLGAHSADDDESPAANRGAAELVFTPFARNRS